MKSRELCARLVRATSEAQVVQILKEASYWDDMSVWKDYGGVSNNWGTGGNQQDNPEGALVEKIVNAVDAMLLRECKRRGIDPEDPQNAPRSIPDAVEQFFGIRAGTLENYEGAQRTRLARNIILMATGKKRRPCLSIIDRGEGQTPDTFEDTFVSLGKENKIRIQFVQGTFCQGGTGAISFCGEHGLQLILSKKDPEIAKTLVDDESRNMWGFTILRLIPPDKTMKGYSIKHLAPDGQILRFSKPLPVLPGKYPKEHSESMEWGTMVKLYDYELSGTNWSIIRLNLYFRLSFLLPRVALPVRMIERRYRRGEKHETTLAGLQVRLKTHSRKQLEIAPYSNLMSVDGHTVKYTVYVFKGDGKRTKKSKAFTLNEAIAFTHNGQAQGYLSYRTLPDKVSYIQKKLLIMVNCDQLPRHITAKMFMPSRDRLRNNDFVRELKKRLKEAIATDSTLLRLNNEARQRQRGKPIEEDEEFFETIQDIILTSPGLEYLLKPGKNLTPPHDLRGVDKEEPRHESTPWPTFFKLESKSKRHIYTSKRVQVRYHTDADDDFFDRGETPGVFKLEWNREEKPRFTIGIRNGLATLVIYLPKGLQEGDQLDCRSTVVSDGPEYNVWEHEFSFEVSPRAKPHLTGTSSPAQPPSKSKGSRRTVTKDMDLPEMREIYKHNWPDTDHDEYSCVIATPYNGTFDITINMDNFLFLHEKKKRKKVDGNELAQKYKKAMYLVTLALLRDHDQLGLRLDEEQAISRHDLVEQVTKVMASVIMPIVCNV